MRKKTENQIDMLQNKIRLLLRQEENSKKKIELQKGQNDSIAQIRQKIEFQKNLNEVRRIREEIELDQRRASTAQQREDRIMGNYNSKQLLEKNKYMLVREMRKEQKNRKD